VKTVALADIRQDVRLRHYLRGGAPGPSPSSGNAGDDGRTLFSSQYSRARGRAIGRNQPGLVSASGGILYFFPLPHQQGAFRRWSFTQPLPSQSIGRQYCFIHYKCRCSNSGRPSLYI
jgi:hypothetical protein